LSEFNSNFLDRFNDKFKGTVLQRLAYVLPFWITRSLHYNSAYYIAQNGSVWRSLYKKMSQNRIVYLYIYIYIYM